MLTYDDSENIRELYKDFNIQAISSSLSSQKVENGGKRIRLRQLLITNFDIKITSEFR